MFKPFLRVPLRPFARDLDPPAELQAFGETLVKIEGFHSGRREGGRNTVIAGSILLWFYLRQAILPVCQSGKYYENT